MANRRMLSLAIINSAKFLKMPNDAQNLYFHLAMRADDDGVVEAFSVMRSILSPEDNIRVLASKRYITILNEDLVAYINDWHEHNNIRPDRKVDSVHQHLLIEMVPDVYIKESKQRADRPKISGTSHGQTTDGLGKGRVGEESLGKGKEVEGKRESPNILEEAEKPSFLIKPKTSTKDDLQSRITRYFKYWNKKENLLQHRYTVANLSGAKLNDINIVMEAYSNEEIRTAVHNYSWLKESPKHEIGFEYGDCLSFLTKGVPAFSDTELCKKRFEIKKSFKEQEAEREEIEREKFKEHNKSKDAEWLKLHGEEE